MGITKAIAGFFGGGDVAEPVEAIGNVFDNLFTSDDERLTHKEIFLRLQQKPQMAQIEINKVQAQHRSRFVAGARPFLLWVCGFGFLMAFIVNPLIEFVTVTPVGMEAKLINMPMAQMLELTLGMLGLAGLRTIEKIKGVAK